jgi:hypothetical protein
MGVSLQELKRHPFIAVKALTFLVAGTVTIWTLGLWESRLLIAFLIFVLPLSLRIAMVIPKVRPIVMEHPGILRWPYCAIAMLMGSALAVPTLPPLFGSELGYPWGYEAADLLWSLETPALAAVAVGGFGVTLAGAMGLKKVFIRSKWKSEVLNRPVLLTAGLLMLPVPAAFATAATLLVTASPYAVLNAADWSFRAFYMVEGGAGAILIFLVFPVALFRSVYRSTLTVVYGESLDAQGRG